MIKLITFIIFVAIVNTSCATYVAHRHVRKDVLMEKAIDSRNPDAIRVANAGGDLSEFGIDAKLGESYQKNRPLMLTANAVDAIALVAGGRYIKDKNSSGGDGANKQVGSTSADINVSGNRGEVNINLNQSTSRDSTTKTDTRTDTRAEFRD